MPPAIAKGCTPLVFIYTSGSQSGRNRPLGAILRGRGRKNKGGDWGQNNLNGGKCSTTNRS